MDGETPAIWWEGTTLHVGDLPGVDLAGPAGEQGPPGTPAPDVDMSQYPTFEQMIDTIDGAFSIVPGILNTVDTRMSALEEAVAELTERLDVAPPPAAPDPDPGPAPDPAPEPVITSDGFSGTPGPMVSLNRQSDAALGGQPHPWQAGFSPYSGGQPTSGWMITDAGTMATGQAADAWGHASLAGLGAVQLEVRFDLLDAAGFQGGAGAAINLKWRNQEVRIQNTAISVGYRQASGQDKFGYAVQGPPPQIGSWKIRFTDGEIGFVLPDGAVHAVPRVDAAPLGDGPDTLQFQIGAASLKSPGFRAEIDNLVVVSLDG